MATSVRDFCAALVTVHECSANMEAHCEMQFQGDSSIVGVPVR